jgi:hypothetical protein
MNCKPGELAMFVRIFDADDAQFIGLVIKVRSTTKNRLGNDVWYYEGERHKDKNGIPVIAFEDISLQPLRGQEGTDEMLRLVGLPQKEAA